MRTFSKILTARVNIKCVLDIDTVKGCAPGMAKYPKRTLNYRKFPKREQKIIVAYKGDIKKISELFAPIGGL
jgi:hypothetical protein